ncbi:CocE/NonD family hydrolase, partial [bacterium]
MRGRSLLPLLALSAFSSLAWADRTLVYRFDLAGSNVGESRTTVKNDGTFEGATTLDIGRKLGTAFSGRTHGAEILEYVLTLDSAGQVLTIRGNAEGATVEVKGQAAPQPLGAAGKIPEKFAAFSPYFLRTLWPRVQAGAGSFDVQLLDGASKQTATIVGTSKRQAGTEPVTLATMRVATIDLQIAFDRAGECVGYDVPAQKLRATAVGFDGIFVSPIDSHPELSAATFATARVTFGVPMRDGRKLATEILRPKTEARVPTILIRTPYGRASEALANGWYAARGYAVVVQDCRGRGESEGAWDPFVNEGRDGKDAVDWIAAQPWS